MPKRYWVVFGTFLLAMLLYIDRILISVAKPEVSRDLGLTDKEMGWVLSIFSLGYALFQVPAGALADKIGARKTLTYIVSLWSVFTAFTGFAWNFISLLIIRFLFGAGEAGAYPSINRAVYSWIPLDERGTVNGINFSAGRLGAAFALPVIAWLIKNIGWQNSFYVLGIIGVFWAIIWYTFFRDEPNELKNLSEKEKNYILTHRQQPKNNANTEGGTITHIFQQRNVWLLMLQYFSSNFTFFFCLTWLFPHLKTRFNLETVEAAFYASLPLIFGAVGNIVAGLMVDFLYKKGQYAWSRKLTAIVGFFLAAMGLFCSIYTESVTATVFFLSFSVMGADMTLSPSWATCSDIGGRNSGTVSGAMNMFGNLGAFLTALIFPYLHDWSGSDNLFFYIGVLLNIMGVFYWLKINPLLKIN
ncbi:MAG: MFS transporter [Saprospiraceae bacterium]|nr:MFS transporter [Saprospiraceae bacterium]